MQFQVYASHQALTPHIRYYWSLKGSLPPTARCAWRFVTEGVELCFNMGDPVKAVMADTPVMTVPDVSLAGALSRPVTLHPEADVDLVGVCFRPGGIQAFLTRPAQELTDNLMDAPSVWPAAGHGLVGRLRDNGLATRAGLAWLDRFFLDRLGSGGPQDLRVGAAVAVIESSRGLIPIGRLAEKTGLSIRQLERKFRAHIGLTPKQMCRSLRFKHALARKARSPQRSWLETALDSGYYDQAHLINDFRHFTGLSPCALFQDPCAAAPFFFAAHQTAPGPRAIGGPVQKT